MNKVLIIGMADSVHLARWIGQFSTTKNEIHFFPSGKFRDFTQEFKVLKKNMYGLKIHSLFAGRLLPGYFDYIFLEITKMLFRLDLRKIWLRRLIDSHEFSIVHAIEIQHAGYLLCDAITGLEKKFKLIVTNWGSDLYFFSEFKDHRDRIQFMLSRVDFYSAECKRDYSLARDLGYQGAFLPLIPNAGGFAIEHISNTPTSERRLILIKANGGTFGNIRAILPVVIQALSEFQDYSAYFYSVTPDVQGAIEEIRQKFPNRVLVSTSSKRLNHHEMLNLFRKSRVYLASSKSDGISTSFLEALVSGTYPIQSDTSCANEWISLGFKGSVVSNDSTSFGVTLRQALSSDELVNSSQSTNVRLAKKYLDEKLISAIAREFYSENYLNALSPDNQSWDR